MPYTNAQSQFPHSMSNLWLAGKSTNLKVDQARLIVPISFGSEFAVREIFVKARQSAPCLLVFEDLDSLITDNVKSVFFNEVDGLESNEGLMMLGILNENSDKNDLLTRTSRNDQPSRTTRCRNVQVCLSMSSQPAPSSKF